MKNNGTVGVFILDRSGSMAGGDGHRRLILCYESIKSEWITLLAIDFFKIV